MQRSIKRHFFWVLLLMLGSCIEPYQHEVIQMPNNYLVVDGFINTGNGPTTFKLTRTQNLGDDENPRNETGATVTIEEEGGARFSLKETGAGVYSINTIPVNPTKRYRLHIKTSKTRAYISDFVPVKMTPAIDALTWEAEPDGLQLQVSTHDPQDNTRYYRWDFEETWEFTASERATGEVVGDTIVRRTAESENIYQCWRTEPSTSIKIGTSSRYNQDLISKFPLQKLAPSSEKLRIGYSILVKQYAQTQEAYAYWEALKKTTESVGGLFDPLPSQFKGNIRSVADSQEPVIGFLSAYSVEQKRLFIGRQELPQQWYMPPPLCQGDSATVSMETAIGYVKNNDPYWGLKGAVYGELNKLEGYKVKYKGCVDCRIYGTNVKPEFWPQ
ncbi:DUF4249 domain-containing protein [Botryobacter ruber]|uniref:DUF4249 domain-containing protein n=1 Tax=Botryobacter ruber TaxID=2171629 RepID=UPI000E0AFFD1|nr:DUF4249 domain-containing protein [Botryobacter ruber]